MESVHLKRYESEEPAFPTAEPSVPATDPFQIDPKPTAHPARRVPICQTGDSILPQPDDTSSTWNAMNAAALPDDPDCSVIEFFEKWMTVEGLTLRDREEQGCNQLVAVSA